MVTRNLIYALIALAAFVWGIALVVGGVSVDPAWLRPFTFVVGVVSIVFALFDRWLWRIRYLHPWLVAIPDLQGTWRGELVSNWVDPATNQGIARIETYAVISQTYSTMRMRVMTKESSSELLGASIIRDLDGNYRVTGTYRNTPEIVVRHRSPIHHGAILLEVVGYPPEALRGHYWTDRDTNGSMVLEARVKERVYEYSRAQLAFADQAELKSDRADSVLSELRARG